MRREEVTPSDERGFRQLPTEVFGKRGNGVDFFRFPAQHFPLCFPGASLQGGREEGMRWCALSAGLA